jgi:hypothetical protein
VGLCIHFGVCINDNNKNAQLETKSRFVTDPLVVGVGLPDMSGFYLLHCPDMLVVELLHHLDQHVTLAVTWEVEMPRIPLALAKAN